MSKAKVNWIVVNITSVTITVINNVIGGISRRVIRAPNHRSEATYGKPC